MSEVLPTPNKKKELATEELLASVNRALPYSDEAEKGVLSCILQDPEGRVSECRRRIKTDDFYHPSNRTVFAVLLEFTDASLPIDLVGVTQTLRDQGKLEQVGGPAAISDLFSFVPIPAHYEYYVSIVQEKAMLRRLIHACSQSIHDAYEHGREQVDAKAVDVLSVAENRVFGVLESAQALGEHSEGPVTAKVGVGLWVEHMMQVIDNRGKIMGLTTGIHEIDLTLHGIDDKEGEICTIAGRPAMGKTAMGGTIVNHLAVEKRIPGMVISAEMSANQLYTRLILGPAGVDTSKAVTGMFSREDQEAMKTQVAKMERSPLLVCDGAAITTADIRAQVQVAIRQHKIRWILVDHLHLIKAVGQSAQKDERMRLVEVMETLQFIKKLGVGVFLLVQMNRDTDKAPGKPPVLADLAGSAAIEQFSDHVIFIHREEVFTAWHRLPEKQQDAWRDLIEPRRQRSPELWSDGCKYDEESGGFARQDYEEKAVLFVRKNRRGPTPELQIRYQKHLTLFSTRMGKLNSTNHLDWQMGTYTQSETRRPTKTQTAGEIGEKKKGGWKQRGGGEDIGEIFPD